MRIFIRQKQDTNSSFTQHTAQKLTSCDGLQAQRYTCNPYTQKNRKRDSQTTIEQSTLFMIEFLKFLHKKSQFKDLRCFFFFLMIFLLLEFDYIQLCVSAELFMVNWTDSKRQSPLHICLELFNCDGVRALPCVSQSHISIMGVASLACKQINWI